MRACAQSEWFSLGLKCTPRVVRGRFWGCMRFSKCVWMFLEVFMGSRCACSILKGEGVCSRIGRVRVLGSTGSQRVCARWKEDEDLLC